MKIKITWFKQSGKYYTSEKTYYDVDYFHQAVAKFKEDLEKGIRPGLVDNVNNEFHALLKIYTEHGPLPFLVLTEQND